MTHQPARTPRSIRVAHAIHSGGFYGAERVVLDLSLEQRRRGEVHPALVDFVDAGEQQSELGRRLAARNADVTALPTNRGVSPAGLRRYAHVLRDLRPDVVHSHGYKPTVFHLLSRRLGLHRVPLVVTAHGYSFTAPSLKERAYRYLDLVMLSQAEIVVAVSHMMQRYLTAASSRIAVQTIQNGIDTHVQPTGAHPVAELLGDAAARPPVIGSVGRLVPMKNHTALIAAYAELRAKGVACRLVILGDGPLRAELEAQWRQSVPTDEPRLIAHQANVLDWMSDMDVFCLPSGPGEGLPMALLEAGILGRAVVCTDSGGIADLIVDSENGMLATMGDHAGLVARLEALVASAELRAKVGTALRNTVVSEHGVEAMEARYAELYRSVAG